MENIINICHYIIQSENEHKRAVTNLRLQKLLYFIQASCLKRLNFPCFAERIEAWKYGPVVPDVYHTYKFYGSIGITVHHILDKDDLITNDATRDVIDDILDRSQTIDTNTLINITHSQNPWINSMNKGEGTEITIEDLRKEFCEN